jgi:copper oxidase (laccase) domain-containing protein
VYSLGYDAFMAERPSVAPPPSALTVPVLLAIPGLVHGFDPGRGARGETRAAAQERVGAALASAGRLLLMTQVHGATVLTAPWLGQPPADAAVAGVPGFLLGIETADCLPVLFVDLRRRVVAAAHAGWRGTAAGVARRVLEVLLAGGSDPGHILAALGPERSRFFRPGPRGRPHLDLRAAVVSQMEGAGLAPANIHHRDDCTFCHADHYHSYRRQGPGGGRMISYVGWAG